MKKLYVEHSICDFRIYIKYICLDLNFLWIPLGSVINGLMLQRHTCKYVIITVND